MAGGAVRMDLELDAEGFESHISKLVGEWPGHREAVLVALAEELVGEIKRDMNTNTGRAKGTVRALETTSSGVEVVAGGEQGVDYILPLLEGSRPHPPGPMDPAQNPSLARWAERNSVPGGFYAIYNHIAQHGTEPHDFVSDPTERMRRNTGSIAEQVLKNRGAFG